MDSAASGILGIFIGLVASVAIGLFLEYLGDRKARDSSRRVLEEIEDRERNSKWGLQQWSPPLKGWTGPAGVYYLDRNRLETIIEGHNKICPDRPMRLYHKDHGPIEEVKE